MQTYQWESTRITSRSLRNIWTMMSILTCVGNIGEYMTNDKPCEFTCVYAKEHMTNCHAIDVCLLKADLVNIKHIQKLKQFSDFTLFSVHW